MCFGSILSSGAGGVLVRGLQNRRQYEANWCLTLVEAS